MAVVGGGDWAGVKHAASTHAGSAQTQTVIRHSPPHPRVPLKFILNLFPLPVWSQVELEAVASQDGARWTGHAQLW